MSDIPNWLILAVLAVAYATVSAPEWGRSLRRAGATIAAAEADLAKREATAWWPVYREHLRANHRAAIYAHRIATERDHAKRAAWRLIRNTETCTGDTR